MADVFAGLIELDDNTIFGNLINDDNADVFFKPIVRDSKAFLDVRVHDKKVGQQAPRKTRRLEIPLETCGQVYCESGKVHDAYDQVVPYLQRQWSRDSGVRFPSNNQRISFRDNLHWKPMNWRFVNVKIEQKTWR